MAKKQNNSSNGSSKGSSTISERIYNLAKPLCDELGLGLWDVRFEKEGTTWYLRVFIDRDDEYITIEDCEKFHRPFNDILDEVDPIDQSYVFEVSGPGLARVLRRPEHFDKCIGDEIRVKTYAQVEELGGMKEFVGTLMSCEDKKITLMVLEKEITLPLSDCAKICLNDDEDLF